MIEAASVDATTRTTAWPRLLFAFAVVVHFAMFLSLVFNYLNPLFEGAGDKGVDFFAVYKGGAYLLHRKSIYGVSFAEYTAPYGSPYRYLPSLAATLGVGLNVFDGWPAYWFWVSMIEVMLAANIVLTRRVVEDKTWGWICASLWLPFTPLYFEELIGQFSFLMATLMFWTIALLNAPYFIAFPSDARHFWDLNFGQYLSHRHPEFSGEMSFVYFIGTTWRAFDSQALDAPAWLIDVVILLILAASLAATFLPRRPDVLVLSAIWTSVYFMTYLAWEHSYVMMLPAFVLLIGLRSEYRHAALVAFALVALPTPYVLFSHMYASNITPFASAESHWSGWAKIIDHACKPLPVLGLWALLCYGELRRAHIERAAR